MYGAGRQKALRIGRDKIRLPFRLPKRNRGKRLPRAPVTRLAVLNKRSCRHVDHFCQAAANAERNDCTIALVSPSSRAICRDPESRTIAQKQKMSTRSGIADGWRVSWALLSAKTKSRAAKRQDAGPAACGETFWIVALGSGYGRLQGPKQINIFRLR